MSEENNQWERKLLEKLASEALVEQRRKRRWGIFFKLIGLVYVGILIASVLGLTTTPSLEVSRHTALVDLDGVALHFRHAWQGETEVGFLRFQGGGDNEVD